MKRNFLIFYVLLLTLFLLTGCVDEFNLNPPHKKVFEKSVKFSGEKELTVICKSGVSDLKIVPMEGNQNNLFNLKVVYDDANQKFFYNYSNSKLIINLEGKSVRKFNSSIILFLSKKVSLKFNLKAGVGDNQINLTGLKVREISIKNGVGDTDIWCKIPNKIDCDFVDIKNGVGELVLNNFGNLHCKNFNYVGGVGDSIIYVYGDWKGLIEGKIKSGVGDIKIFIDPEVGAKLKIFGSKYTSSLTIDQENFILSGNNTYITRYYDSSKRKILFEIHTGVGNIGVKVK